MLIATYHAIEPGPPPLCIDPDRFCAQLDALKEAGADTLTVSEVAECLRSGTLPERAVAITFDDGCASVLEQALPALVARGMRATIFCVAGRIGGDNGWASQPRWVRRMPLAGARELAEAAELGFEIGSHGSEHLPLSGASDRELRREIVDSRAALEQAVGANVPCFAYPYGLEPPPAARPLLESTYLAACGADVRRVRPHDDRLALPRVDAHYLRRPWRMRRAAVGRLDLYLDLRRRAAAARRAATGRLVPATGR